MVQALSTLYAPKQLKIQDISISLHRLPQFDFYLVLITYASHKLKFQNTGKQMRHC